MLRNVCILSCKTEHKKQAVRCKKVKSGAFYRLFLIKSLFLICFMQNMLCLCPYAFAR